MKNIDRHNINNVDKQVPYVIPGNVFESMQDRVMDQARREGLLDNSFEPKAINGKSWLGWRSVLVASVAVAALIALFVVFEPFGGSDHTETSSPIMAENGKSSWIQEMSDEDLVRLNDMMSCDVFLY